jgi:hypothetical protein
MGDFEALVLADQLLEVLGQADVLIMGAGATDCCKWAEGGAGWARKSHCVHWDGHTVVCIVVGRRQKFHCGGRLTVVESISTLVGVFAALACEVEARCA